MEESLRYVFGPVPSRRLGRSLGVNPIPFKTCNYSCVYCQLGKAINFINKRECFFPPREMAEEIISVCLSKKGKIDYITFVGEGEPTLYSGLFEVTKLVKEKCSVPLALITNGALFYKAEVRKDITLFDLVLTKLDAPSEKVFRRINRPHRDIHFEHVLSGLFELKREYSGKIWIETMLVKGINDSVEVLEGIRSILDRLNPDKRFVSIPTRPPAERWVEIPDPDVLFMAFKILNAIPIYDVEYGEFDLKEFKTPEDAVLSLIKRHPLRKDEVSDILKKWGYKGTVDDFINKLLIEYNVKLKEHMGYTYLLPHEARI